MVIAPKPIELSEASSSADSASSTPESGGDYRLLDVGRARQERERDGETGIGVERKG